MAHFDIGTVVTTTTNTVTVDATATSFLPSGTYHFQLVVVDEEGNQSDPVTATVVVKDTIKPTAVLTISPTQAQLGQTFTLDGSKSSDVAPGTLKSFIWTLVSKS